MKRIIAISAVSLLFAAPIAQSAVSDEQFNQLKQMLEQALERIDELEAQQIVVDSVQQEEIVDEAVLSAGTAEQVAANTARLDKLSWAEKTRWEGDFRYRYQNEDVGQPVNDTRNRNRIRARAALIADLASDLEVGIGLASGSDDPVSVNQTLGGGGSTKSINMDLAYFSWTGLDQTTIRGGKVKNTFVDVGNQLQWDSDWRPEGIDVAWDNGTFFAQGLGTYLESDSNRGNSEFAYVLQAGGRAELGPIAFTGGIGYSDIDAQGKACYFDEDDNQLCFGNEAVDDGGTRVYVNDFQVYNVFAEAAVSVAEMPLTFFADFIKNDAATQYDSGYLIGAQLGKAKKKGTWELRYYYEDIESNATLGLLTNSDFGGGGTNGKGSVFAGAYALSDKTNVALTYFLVDRNSDRISTINGGQQISADTLQADLNFKFK